MGLSIIGDISQPYLKIKHYYYYCNGSCSNSSNACKHTYRQTGSRFVFCNAPLAVW